LPAFIEKVFSYLLALRLLLLGRFLMTATACI
jgi:hypothetical protein